MTEIDEAKEAAIRYFSMLYPDESRSQVEGRLQAMVQAMANGVKKVSKSTECANCEWSGMVGQTHVIKDLASRLEPGNIVPAGECPECGALCYLV